MASSVTLSTLPVTGSGISSVTTSTSYAMTASPAGAVACRTVSLSAVEGAVPKRSSLLPSISEAGTRTVSTPASTGGIGTTASVMTEAGSNSSGSTDGKKQKQSKFKHANTGLMRADLSSPLIGVSSNIMQYNGPHCMDVKDERLEVKHGLHLDYVLRLKSHIKTVLFYPKKQSCTVLSAGGIHRYIKNSLDEEFEDIPAIQDLNQLLYASEFGVYVGVCKQRLKLLNKSFQSVYEVDNPGRITAAGFNQFSGEVVTASPGKIMTWVFRQGAKTLALSFTFTHGLFPEEEIHLFHFEPVPGNAQRVFAGLGCSVKVFLMVSGKPLEHLRDIHSKPISAILFFRPLRLLLTASKDGSIKVWNSSRLLCATFVGHSGPVTSLVPYPYGPMVVSCSLDSTIRVWDLTTFDQVQKVESLLPVEGLHSEPGTYSLLSYSSRQLKVWYIMQLYAQAANIGSPSTHLQASAHPLLPLRVLSACADSAVRVVSPITGDVLTTALLLVKREIAFVCYNSLLETLYVLDDCGSVCVFDSQQNPASLTSTWQCPHGLGTYSCLALYETAMDEEEISELLEFDKWLGVTLEARQLAGRHRQAEKDPLQSMMEGEFLLLAGTTEGHVAVLGSDGRVQFSAHGHDSPVAIVASNPKRDHVITAGRDPMLNVWEVSPHSQEPLYLLSSFSLASPASHLVCSKDRLCVTRNNPELASYTLDMFDIATKEIFSADPDTSHADTITGVDVTHKMRLFASCSLDCTVRIWTEENLPVRILHLDVAPDGIVFCSQQADIVIAIHTHLYTIANYTYFTEMLHKQIVAFMFPEVVGEVHRNWGVDMHTLEPEDRARLLLVDNTISQDSYSGDLSAEEMALVEEAAKHKTSAMSLIVEREKEIRAISEGSLSLRKSRTSLTRKEKELAWRCFLKLLRPDDDSSEYVIPEEDTFDPDRESSLGVDESRFKSPRYTKTPNHTFFPPLATFDPPYPVAPDGMLPNSVLLSKMRKSEEDQRLALNWVPPSISRKQRDLMAEMEEEEEEEEEEEDREDSDMMERLKAALAAEGGSAETSPTPPPTPSPPPTPPRRLIVPSKPIEKLIAPKPKHISPKRTPPSLSPKIRTPTPSPPPTPLPEFITQFFGEPWFETLFPNRDLSAFTKPWTVSAFIELLLKKSAHPLVTHDIRGHVCRSILKLMKDYEVTNTVRDNVYKTILSMLRGPPVLSTLVPYEEVFVRKALKLLIHLNKLDSVFTVVLMVVYMEGGEELREIVMGYFVRHGLRDPQGYFKEAMLGLPKVKRETLTAQGGRPGTGVLHGRSNEWLEHWIEEFHLNSYSKTLDTAGKSARKSLMRIPSKDMGVSAKQRVSFSKEPVKSPSLPAHKPVDVLNYFVTVEHERALARLRAMTPSPVPTPEPQEELKRNTIIALPKITKNRMLTRLGETHCSQCHPERETSLMLLHHLPHDYNRPHPSDSTRLWKHFTSYLALALTPQNINPFLTEEERLALEPVSRGSLQAVTKYFVHERSYVRTPNQ